MPLPRIAPALIVTCILSASVSTPAAAEPPTDAEVFNCIRTIQMKYAEMEAEDFTMAKRQFRAMISEKARGLRIAELTPIGAAQH